MSQHTGTKAPALARWERLDGGRVRDAHRIAADGESEYWIRQRKSRYKLSLVAPSGRRTTIGFYDRPEQAKQIALAYDHVLLLGQPDAVWALVDSVYRCGPWEIREGAAAWLLSRSGKIEASCASLVEAIVTASRRDATTQKARRKSLKSRGFCLAVKGKRKRRYKTQLEAVEKTQNTEVTGTYLCRHCGDWHITRSRRVA